MSFWAVLFLCWFFFSRMGLAGSPPALGFHSEEFLKIATCACTCRILESSWRFQYVNALADFLRAPEDFHVWMMLLHLEVDSQNFVFHQFWQMFFFLFSGFCFQFARGLWFWPPGPVRPRWCRRFHWPQLAVICGNHQWSVCHAWRCWCNCPRDPRETRVDSTGDLTPMVQDRSDPTSWNLQLLGRSLYTLCIGDCTHGIRRAPESSGLLQAWING